jgi:hypothetical protein
VACRESSGERLVQRVFQSLPKICEQDAAFVYRHFRARPGAKDTEKYISAIGFQSEFPRLAIRTEVGRGACGATSTYTCERMAQLSQQGQALGTSGARGDVDPIYDDVQDPHEGSVCG